MFPPLPGQWLDFGDDVFWMAAHPSRPWIALVRELGNGVVAEHHDLTTGATLSVTDVPSVGVALVWVGDRIALVVLSPALEASYVDVGSGRVDVVYVHNRQDQSGLRLRPLGLDRFEFTVKDAGFFRHHQLALRDGATTLIEHLFQEHCYSDPDGGRSVVTDHSDAKKKAWLKLTDARGTRRYPVRYEHWERYMSVSGWPSPQEFLIIEINTMRPESEACAVWVVSWRDGKLRPLQSIGEHSGWADEQLSPDGRYLALLLYEDHSAGRALLVVMDPHVDQLLLREAVTLYRKKLRWLNADTVIASSTEEKRLHLVLCSMTDRRPQRYTLADETSAQKFFDHIVRAVDSRRLFVSPYWKSGRCFVSEPVIPTEDEPRTSDTV